MRTLLICTTTALALLGTQPQAQGQETEQRTADPSEFAGNWVGSLSVGTVQLRMRFEIGESGGELTASVFSLDQGNAQVPVESVTLTGATMTIAMPVAGATYEGTLSADGNSIEGSFAQMGSTLTLILERTDAEETEARRPQDPVEPLPYLSEDVSYPNPDGGHTLAGTFTRPESGGPFAAVILISGSGPQDRDEALLGHRPFLVLSDHLTRRGIAVLRFDDRGVGESTGNSRPPPHATSPRMCWPASRTSGPGTMWIRVRSDWPDIQKGA
ncbi:MAG: hypothetical protein OXN18_07530 [Gemmatimonadota bacterium]|nr:hypothetical protein [Gemmatimonadota bacterium]